MAEFVTNHCAIYVEKQRVNLKHGAHVPQVLQDQGEVVYVDLIGPFSNQVSCCRYLGCLGQEPAASGRNSVDFRDPDSHHVVQR